MARTPQYRRHKASGKAVVTLGGRDFYLGTYGSAESRKAYERLLGEYLAAGRALPVSPGTDFTIAELLVRFCAGPMRNSHTAANSKRCGPPFGRCGICMVGPRWRILDR